MLDGTKILSETVTDNAYYNNYTLYYVYDVDGSITGLHYSNQPYYFQKNIQGDILRILDRTGTAVVEYTYDAWGNILSVTGSLASTVGQINPFRYRGYYYDSETDLYYLNSRYYDAEVGRFISADSYVSTGQGILGNNMFAYCNNSPVSRIDTLGTDSVAVVGNEDRNPMNDLYLGSGGAAIGGNSIALSPPSFSPQVMAATVVIIAGTTIITKVAKEKLNERNHTVYALVDAKNVIQYIGRTTDVDKRQAAHKKHPLRGSLDFVVLADGLTYLEARAYEQAAMLYHHTINTANKMNNQINGISPSNWKPFQLIGLGALQYTENQMSNEILYWTENFG